MADASISEEIPSQRLLDLTEISYLSTLLGGPA